MPSSGDPIGKIPLRGRLRLLKDSLTYVPTKEGDTFRYRDIIFFTRYLAPLKWVILASLILTTFYSLLGTVFPLSSKWIIDYIFLHQSPQPVYNLLSASHLGFLIPYGEVIFTSLPLLIGTIAVLSVIRYLIGGELSFINFRINEEYGYRVKIAVFSRVMLYPISYFQSIRSGYLHARINADIEGISMISLNLVQSLFASGTTLCVSTIVLFYLSVPLTVFVILTVPFNVAISYWIIRISRSYDIRMRESGLQIAAGGQDLLSSIDLIKIHAVEDRELGRYMKNTMDNISLRISNMLFGKVTSSINLVIKGAVTLAVMLFGGGLVLSNQMSIGDYTAFLVMFPQMTGALSSFFLMPVSLQGTAIAAGRVKELLDMATEYEHDEPGRNLIIPDHQATGHILLEHVSFAYDRGDRVFTDLSVDIRPKDRIGIIGPTGEGKTTFISLLLKFYRPGSGSITLDGYQYADLNPAWIRSQVAVVSQDLLLFHDTVMNNIRFSRDGATDDEVIAAAKSAGIHDEIVSFPDGYQTIVGERGSKLSGGQKQRIAIARAILRNVPILILDEPTAHLDLRTEEKLIPEFLKICAEKTVIVITHRESLLRLVQRVYRIEGGQMTLVRG